MGSLMFCLFYLALIRENLLFPVLSSFKAIKMNRHYSQSGLKCSFHLAHGQADPLTTSLTSGQFNISIDLCFYPSAFAALGQTTNTSHKGSA